MTAEEIAHNARMTAEEPPRAVTFADMQSLFSMVATLANIVATIKPAGRPKGSPNKPKD